MSHENSKAAVVSGEEDQKHSSTTRTRTRTATRESTTTSTAITSSAAAAAANTVGVAYQSAGISGDCRHSIESTGMTPLIAAISDHYASREGVLLEEEEQQEENEQPRVDKINDDKRKITEKMNSHTTVRISFKHMSASGKIASMTDESTLMKNGDVIDGVDVEKTATTTLVDGSNSTAISRRRPNPFASKLYRSYNTRRRANADENIATTPSAAVVEEDSLRTIPPPPLKLQVSGDSSPSLPGETAIYPHDPLRGAGFRKSTSLNDPDQYSSLNMTSNSSIFDG